MYLVEYTILKYYKSAISDECLDIGVVYSNITTGQRNFKYISDFKRFQAFDDEADIDFIKLYLKGLKDQVENSTNDNGSFDLFQFTRIFVNEFRFSEVIRTRVKDDDCLDEILSKCFADGPEAHKKKILNIGKLINCHSALTREQGKIIYDLIEPMLHDNINVVLDFSEIESIITPFLNVSIGKLYEKYDSKTLQDLLEVKNYPEGFVPKFNRVVNNAKQLNMGKYQRN